MTGPRVNRSPRSPSGAVSVYRQSEWSPAAVPAADPFESGLRALARDIRESVADLDPKDRDWLYELAREESRYPMPTVRRLCRLASRSRKQAVRNAFAELIRRECLAGDDMTVTNAFGMELRSNGPEDVASRDFEKDRNPVTYAAAKAALQQQLGACELKLLTLVRWGRANGMESGQAAAAGRSQ